MERPKVVIELKERLENCLALGCVLNQLETKNSCFTGKEEGYLHKKADLFKRLTDNLGVYINQPWAYSPSKDQELKDILNMFGSERYGLKDNFEGSVMRLMDRSYKHIKELLKSPATFYASGKSKELLGVCKRVEGVYKLTRGDNLLLMVMG